MNRSTRRARAMTLGIAGIICVLGAQPLAAKNTFTCDTQKGYKHDIPFYPDDHMHMGGVLVDNPGGDYWEQEEETLWAEGTADHQNSEPGYARTHHSSSCSNA